MTIAPDGETAAAVSGDQLEIFETEARRDPCQPADRGLRTV